MNPDSFAWHQGQTHYKTTNSFKMPKKRFISHTKYAYTVGCAQALYGILAMHKKNPYKDLHELIGDIQVLMVEYSNDAKIFQKGRPVKLDLEDIMSFMESESV